MFLWYQRINRTITKNKPMKNYSQIASIILFKIKVGFINLAIGAGSALRS